MEAKASAGPEPAVIHRLDPDVVNRIAAGEVIQRPSNAIKELLENSLDAGCTSISVVVAEGGLRSIQITDNGSGIRKEDLQIVCERFTTSKLSTYEQLASGNVSTFGFRGEALASISHVARLTIMTKTRDQAYGFKTNYLDGKPAGESKPTAANQGTQIIVEELFYNVPTRRKALKSADEFHRIADVMSRYAVHKAGVAFTLKKDGDGTLYVRTQKEATAKDNIGAIFGHTIAKELLEISTEDKDLKLRVRGLVSNVNFNTKKYTFLLFINDRLVECPSLKRAVEAVYESHLPRGTHPFVYLSLFLDPAHVDVNVHPTKHEVQFLNQDDVIESVQRGIEETIMASASSRTFHLKFVTGTPPKATSALNKADSSANVSRSVKEAPKNLVRVDASQQKLDHLVLKARPVDSTGIKRISSASSEGPSSKQPANDDAQPEEEESGGDTRETQASCRTKDKVDKREIKLTSLANLRKRVLENSSTDLTDLVSNHSFVGCVDRKFTLLQHGTRLFLVHNGRISEHFFYQRLLQDFGNIPCIQLDPPPLIRDLARMALDGKESGWTEADGDKDQLAKCVVQLFMERSEMLDDYFSLEIDDDGHLLSLPMLVDGYVPYFGALPYFILRLATEVNWGDEENCFDTFCVETAKFYAVKTDENARFDAEQHFEAGQSESDDERWKQSVELLFAAFKRSSFSPPKSALDDMTFVQVANLPDLYRVFERC